MIFSNLEKTFLEKRAEFFNEHDRGNFISSSKYALRENVSQFYISVKSDYAAVLLQQAESYLSKITVDPYAVSEFINKILGSEEINTAGLSMTDVSHLDTTVIKSNYLRESVDVISTDALKIIQGVYDINKVKQLCAEMDSYKTALKKRIAKSGVDYNMSEVELMKFQPQPLVPVTNAYLESTVIPFIGSISKTKATLANELSVVRQSVNYAVTKCSDIVKNLHTTLIRETLKPKVEILLSKFIYARIRATMDAVAYTTFIMMRKLHYYEQAISSIQDVYNRLMLLFSSKMPLVEYGVFDNRTISPGDIKSIVGKMVEGKTDVYDELSANILEFHRGHISIIVGLNDSTISSGDLTDYFDTLRDHYDYDQKSYLGIVNAYSAIGRGLDILAANSDDYLMIFDEIINKSGLVLDLSSHFKNDIDALEDSSSYSLADINTGDNRTTKDDLYFHILSEISQFPANAKMIAKAIHEVHVKLNYVAGLFHDDNNGELEYSETMNELKIFISGLSEQFDLMNEKVCGNLFKRLKLLAAKAELCTGNNDETTIDNPLSSPDYSLDDFFKEAVLESISFDSSINDVMMEILMKEYYSAKSFLERGVRLIYEADDAPQTTTTTAPTNNTAGKANTNNAKANTTPTITDNNTEVKSSANKSSGKINQAKVDGILKSIGEWFNKMIESFNNMIERIKVKNLNWIKNHKDGLTKRSYANVQINILPYDNMSTETILGDINKMSTSVRSMNADRAKSITSQEAMRNALINFGPKFNNKNIDETTAITTYYKVGNKPLETITYSNNEVKTLVVNTMLPYCEQFYDNFKNGVETRLTEVKKSMESVIKTYVTESMELFATGSIFMEADNVTTAPASATSDENKNAATSMVDATKWIRDYVRMFSGSILNAIRDRNNDYLKVLFALAPKETANTTAQKQDNEETNAEPDVNDNNQTAG